jgi:23S rRNA (guanine745-N1)-methyltransferase
MSTLICPVCKNDLMEAATSYYCQLNHTFDKSRHGYVNLLLPNKKQSKEPGDNKEMTQSRASFLSKGYYEAISNHLNQHVKEKLNNQTDTAVIDIGCGNGYYLNRLRGDLDLSTYYGIDISKEAIHLAAKHIKDIKWIVSSIAELPIHDQSLEGIISIFSPLNFAEFKRILRDDGFLFVVCPSSRHLYELREILFSDVKTIENNRILENSDVHFTVDAHLPLNYSINLTSNEDIKHLFSMTPYYWRCTPDKRQYIMSLSHLTLTIDIGLWVFKKRCL